MRTVGSGNPFARSHRFDLLMVAHVACLIIEFVRVLDDATPSARAVRWFKRLHAPSKRLVIIAASSHVIFE